MNTSLKSVKKLSAKAVCGPIKNHLPHAVQTRIVGEKPVTGNFPANGQEVKLFRVYGTAMGVKKGDSTFGAWVAFQGQFEAVAHATGEITRSNQLFLPEVAELMLYPAVMDSSNENGVKFSFEIGAVANNTQVGYEYTIRTLGEVAENDALAAMRAEFALPAPAPDEKQMALSILESAPAPVESPAADEPKAVHAETAELNAKHGKKTK